jgi:hypothetical protein
MLSEYRRPVTGGLMVLPDDITGSSAKTRKTARLPGGSFPGRLGRIVWPHRTGNG